MDKKQYHHGDLKQDLVQKGIQLLAREGYEGFSMRKLASLCGVSHAAPYKHFQNREEIIEEIGKVISFQFAKALSVAVNIPGCDKRSRLIAMCREYVRFMAENPDYFRFVFMTSHHRPIEIGGSIDSGNRPPLTIALDCIRDYFQPLHGEGWHNDFMAIWSMLQGYVLMLILKTIDPGEDYLNPVQAMAEGYLGRE